MSNNILVVIDGDEIKKFVSVSIDDSLDSLASAFSFSIAQDENDAKIVQNAGVRIYVNFDLVLTGKIYKISNSYDTGAHNIVVSGFSNTYELTRATIFKNPNYSTPISFLDLSEKLMKDNEVQGVEVSLTFAALKEIFVVDDDENRTAGDIGETLFSFLDRYAKQVGVILTTDLSGNMVIYENDPKSSSIRLRNKRDFFNNKLIKSADYTNDYTKRFKKIIVRSQNEDEETIEAFALDNTVEAFGVLTIISETLADIAGCQTQANWEVNKRRADSVRYNCQVFGFSPEGEDQSPWKTNTLVDVDDDFAGIKSRMIIRAVRFSYSDTEGSVTDLSLTIPDAFGQKVSPEDRYNAIFGDVDDLDRYDQLFGVN